MCRRFEEYGCCYIAILQLQFFSCNSSVVGNKDSLLGAAGLLPWFGMRLQSLRPGSGITRRCGAASSGAVHLELSELHHHSVDHSVVISGFSMVKAFQFSSSMKEMASRRLSRPHHSTLEFRNATRLAAMPRS